jgi:hypothetical protein
MSYTPLHERTNTFGLPTPPPSFRDLPPSAFNDRFTAANFIASNENTRDTPATVEPPTKRRRIETSFKDKTDTEVWALSDEEIIGASPALRLVLHLNEVLQRSSSQNAPPARGSTILSPSNDTAASSLSYFNANRTTPNTQNTRATGQK